MCCAIRDTNLYCVYNCFLWQIHFYFVYVLGADVVDWLYSRVEGFKDRRDARKYASSLLKHGYLRHTVNKITFSEQCYYTFGDLCQSMLHLLFCLVYI